MDKIHDKKRYFTNEEKRIILSKTNGKCAHCGCGLDMDSMTIDHVFPKSKGGLNDEYNLLPLCEDCNEMKSDSVFYLRDFYKYIDGAEEEQYHRYNNFASYDYTSKTIAGYDESLFYNLEPSSKAILAQMKKRGASKRKIVEMSDKLLSKFVLRKAYPANAKDIYELINTVEKKYNWDNPFYQSEYHVLEDINYGCVYILERNDELLGAFLFKNAQQFKDAINYPQLDYMMDYFHLKIRYIMAGCFIKRSAVGVFENIMRYMELSQIHNRMVPLFFNILSMHYINSDKCISVPFTAGDIDTKLEFFPIGEFKELNKERCEWMFKKSGYKKYTEEELDLYSELLIKFTHQKHFRNNEEAMTFFEKYPLLMDYFKPESFELYGVGFVTR